MIILDEPYASDILLDWLESSGHPVLANDFTKKVAQKRDLTLVSDAEAAKRINSGERVYTNSENALAWILDNTDNDILKKGIRVFKDKADMRKKLKSLDPDLFFEVMDVADLQLVDPSKLPLPIVLKPSVGFCSMGVYTIENEEDWRDALANIESDTNAWRKMYPESVIEPGVFVLEEYIQGQEYAIDAFYDGEGKTHILNVLKHDFVSPEDTSDRMYTTSSRIYTKMEPIFRKWLDEVNGILGLKDFPMHVEVRVDGGHISPIEFNPLRFAGLGGTDVAYYAYGYRTYEAYLEDKIPDFEEAFSKAGTKVYTMSLLNPPEDAAGNEIFDYDSFCSCFENVLEMRRFDVKKVGNYGFLFIETEDGSDELNFLLHSDLKEFLS